MNTAKRRGLKGTVITLGVGLAVVGVTLAGAQPTESVMVSNLAEAASSSVGTTSGQQYAQSFCTGPFAVMLTKVRLPTSTSRTDPAPSVTIRADGSGKPGQTVATLSNPATFDEDIATNEDFTSSGVELAANSSYWLVISAQNPLDFSITESRNETAAAGWSMIDKLYGNNGGWGPAFISTRRPDGFRMRMAVYASGDTPSTTQPVFPCGYDAASATMEVNENTAAATAVGQVAAMDPDSDPVTYSVSGADAAAFNQVFSLNTSTAEITVKTGATPNYEDKRSYAITLDATDGEDASGDAESPAVTDDSISITINVKNLDETGTVTLSPETPAVGSLYEAALADPDGKLLVVSVEWERADVAAGPFTSIGGNNVECESRGCYTPAVADQDKFLKVTIVYYDGASGPRNSRGQLMIFSSDPTKDRRTLVATSANAVVMGGL